MAEGRGERRRAETRGIQRTPSKELCNDRGPNLKPLRLFPVIIHRNGQQEQNEPFRKTAIRPTG